MVKALLHQQFPRLAVEGVEEVENTGNFIVRTARGETLWPYGFVSTSAKQFALLERVRARFAE